MHTRTAVAADNDRAETRETLQPGGANDATGNGTADPGSAPTFTVANIGAGNGKPTKMTSDKPRFLYYYYDADTGRITLTGFVSASSRRDARRRLRMMGLRA